MPHNSLPTSPPAGAPFAIRSELQLALDPLSSEAVNSVIRQVNSSHSGMPSLGEANILAGFLTELDSDMMAAVSSIARKERPCEGTARRPTKESCEGETEVWHFGQLAFLSPSH